MTPIYNMPANIMADILAFKTAKELFYIISQRTKSLHYHALVALFKLHDDDAQKFQVKLMISWIRHWGLGGKLSFIQTQSEKELWQLLFTQCFQIKNVLFINKFCCGMLLNYCAPPSPAIKNLAFSYARGLPELDGHGPDYTGMLAPYYNDQSLLACIEKMELQIQAEGLSLITMPNKTTVTNLTIWTGYETLLQIAPLLKPEHVERVTRFFISRINHRSKSHPNEPIYTQKIILLCKAIAKIDLFYSHEHLQTLFTALDALLFHSNTEVQEAVLQALKKIIKQLPLDPIEKMLAQVSLDLNSDSRQQRARGFQRLAYLSSSFNESQLMSWTDILFEKYRENTFNPALVCTVFESFAPLFSVEQAKNVLRKMQDLFFPLNHILKLIPLLKDTEKLNLHFLIAGILRSDIIPRAQAFEVLSKTYLTSEQLDDILPLIIEFVKRWNAFEDEKSLSAMIERLSDRQLSRIDTYLWEAKQSVNYSWTLFKCIFVKLKSSEKIKWIPQLINLINRSDQTHYSALSFLASVERQITDQQLQDLLNPIIESLNLVAPVTGSYDFRTSRTSHYFILNTLAAIIPLAKIPQICSLLRNRLTHSRSEVRDAACLSLVTLSERWPETEALACYTALLPYIFTSPEAAKSIAKIGLLTNSEIVSNLFNQIILFPGHLPPEVLNGHIESLHVLMPSLSAAQRESVYHIVENSFMRPGVKRYGIMLMTGLFPFCDVKTQDIFIAQIADMLEPKFNHLEQIIFPFLDQCMDHFTSSQIIKLLPTLKKHTWTIYEYRSRSGQKILGSLISRLDDEGFERLRTHPQFEEFDVNLMGFIAEMKRALKNDTFQVRDFDNVSHFRRHA